LVDLCNLRQTFGPPASEREKEGVRSSCAQL
jgi:hypothetical protein